MKVYLEGRNMIIRDISIEEAKSLKTMIECANLPERRTFNSVKRQIDENLRFLQK